MWRSNWQLVWQLDLFLLWFEVQSGCHLNALQGLSEGPMLEKNLIFFHESLWTIKPADSWIRSTSCQLYRHENPWHPGAFVVKEENSKNSRAAICSLELWRSVSPKCPTLSPFSSLINMGHPINCHTQLNLYNSFHSTHFKRAPNHPNGTLVALLLASAQWSLTENPCVCFGK